jgi:hypothetical protein
MVVVLYSTNMDIRYCILHVACQPDVLAVYRLVIAESDRALAILASVQPTYID